MFNKAFMAEMLGLAVSTQLAQVDGESRVVHTDCEAAKAAYDNGTAYVVKFNPHWVLATAMHQARTVPVLKVKAHPERFKKSAFYTTEDWGGASHLRTRLRQERGTTGPCHSKTH